MQTINVGAVGAAGFVRACFSSRQRGHAVPADLLRAHLRGVQRSQVRRRVAAEFSGYLVTEPAALPIWRDSSGRVVQIWPESKRVRGLVGDDGVGGEKIACMDAPDWMAAGSMLAGECAGDVYAVARSLFRDGWYE